MIRFCRDALRVMCQPCRAQTERISRCCDEALSTGERFGLRFHLAFCRSCRRFRRQVALLRDLAAGLGREIETGETLPAEVRDRVLTQVSRDSKNF